MLRTLGGRIDVIGSGVIAVPHVLLHWLANDPEARGAFTSLAGRSMRPEELEPALREAFWQEASLTWEGIVLRLKDDQAEVADANDGDREG
jgi:hypothetical protein